MNRQRASTAQGHAEAEVIPSIHKPNHHPLKSTWQCLTASSYKMTLSHPLLEVSTAEAVIMLPVHVQQKDTNAPTLC
jgi:hypothetical protein